MTTVRQRRAMMERGRLSFTNPPPPEELNVFLVTAVRTTAKMNPETGEPEATTKTEANTQERAQDIDRILRLKEAGHQRLQNTRVFRLHVDDDGVPSIGDEVHP